MNDATPVSSPVIRFVSLVYLHKPLRTDWAFAWVRKGDDDNLL